MKAIAKKTILMTLILSFAGLMPLLAQTGEDKEDAKRDRSEMYERMKSAKIAFITERLKLTPQEAEKFWPLYNEYEKKRNEITEDLFKRFDMRQEKPEPPKDDEADKIIKQRFDEEKALLDLKKEYYEKYKDVLNPARIFILYDAENDFRRHILEKMDHARGERDTRHGSDSRPEPRMERPGPR